MYLPYQISSVLFKATGERGTVDNIPLEQNGESRKRFLVYKEIFAAFQTRSSQYMGLGTTYKLRRRFDPYLTLHMKVNSTQTKGAKYEKNSNKIHESLKKKSWMPETLLNEIKERKKTQPQTLPRSQRWDHIKRSNFY